MSLPLCFDFLRHADWVWECLGVAHENGFAFNEPTITETVLLDLKARHSDKLIIKPSRGRDERWNGADWEWWIGWTGNWIGMRVQAKRIYLPDESYNELFYKSKNSSKPQIDILLEKAQAADLVPIYTLYSHSFDEPSLQTKVQHCVVKWEPSFHECGCLVAHAQDIKVQGSRKLSEIARFAFPWHWLVCHCLIGGVGSAGPADFVADLFARSGDKLTLDKDPQTERFVPKPQEKLPDHIEALRYEDGGRREDILNKHCRKWDLGGVALFDLRKDEDDQAH